jgi:glycosyltransferase involved in cell wall biosynthesis
LVRQKNPQFTNKRVFLYLGRLNFRQKGLEILLPAFHNAVLKKTKIHLIIAGPDEHGGELLVRKKIAELGLNQQVTLTGMLDDSKKLEYLQIADIFVLPSPSEGLSIALLEALYMNLPVIVTTGVGLHKTIQENNVGVIIDYDQDQLSEAILSLTEEVKIAELEGRGKEIINSSFTWNKIAQQFLDELNTIKIGSKE